MQYARWRHFGHVLGTLTIELKMKPALATGESRINTGVKLWALVDLDQRPPD